MSAVNPQDVVASTVVGFSHGSNHTEVKVLEAKLAMDKGALELVWSTISFNCVLLTMILYVEISERSMILHMHAEPLLLRRTWMNLITMGRAGLLS
jgi:deoxyribose-phosphate aldolase